MLLVGFRLRCGDFRSPSSWPLSILVPTIVAAGPFTMLPFDTRLCYEDTCDFGVLGTLALGREVWAAAAPGTGHGVGHAPL